jgi:erythromycin esterase-like protein
MTEADRPMSDLSSLTERVRAAAQPLPDIEDEAFAAAFDRFADAKVVLLGEASHGGSEFYRARAAITRRLVERHGFNIIGLEADWPDAAALDRYVRWREGPKDGPPFRRFPTWMWRNREMAAFVESLKALNAGRPAEARAEIRGLDLYSLNASITAVLEHLDDADPDAARHARDRYGCLRPWSERPELYGMEVMRTGRTCEAAVVTQLMAMLAQELERGGADEADFDAQQNARVIQAAETYYRAMYWGAVESWNLRDRHMFDTLLQVMGRRGSDAKAVVWAHNSHIGNARATAMGDAGEWNVGQLCREWFADQAVLIGFGSHTGEVAAASDWGGEMHVKPIRPSREDSWERVFHDAGVSPSLTDWRGDPALAAALAETRLERAIGVIYRPETERLSHYFDARLSHQFDAYVWFDETAAVTPLPGPEDEAETPDTWPFGL